MIKTILKNISWLSGFEAISVGLGFLFFAILGRTLGETGFGAYTYIISTLLFLSMILDFGSRSYFMRKWSTTPQHAPEDISTFIGFRLALSVPLLAAFGIYLITIEQHLRIEFLLAFFAVILDLFRAIYIIFLQTRDQYGKGVLIDALEKLLSMGGGALALLMGSQLITIFAVQIFSKILALILSMSVTKLRTLPTLNPSQSLATLRSSSGLFFIAFLTAVYFRVDIFMIRFYSGLGEVGIYSAVTKLIETSFILPVLIATAITPTLTRMVAKSSAAARRLLIISTVTVGVVGFLGSIVISLFAPEILDLIYRGSFYSGYESFIILGWSIPFFYMNILLVRYLIAHQQEIVATLVYGSLIGVNVGLNSALIPKHGHLGAAATTLLCETIAFIVLFSHVLRKQKRLSR